MGNFEIRYDDGSDVAFAWFVSDIDARNFLGAIRERGNDKFAAFRIKTGERMPW